MGMVTELDLRLAIDQVGEEFPISCVMLKDVVSIRPDATLGQAVSVILKHNYRRLAVIEYDMGIGVLLRRDLLRVRFGL